MAIIKVESDIPGLTATIIDGYLCERGELEKIWKEIYETRRSGKLTFPKDESLEYIAIGAAWEAQLSFMDKVKCNLAEYCNLSLFKTNEDNIIKKPYSQLYVEEHILKRKKDTDTHYILHVSKNCKNLDGCLNYVIRAINFVVKQPKDYHDYGKFTKSVSKLIDSEIFLPYILPHRVVRERLENLGLQCVIS